MANEDQIEADNLASDMCAKDVCRFWNDVKNIKSNNSSVTSTVGGCTGEKMSQICGKITSTLYGTLSLAVVKNMK